MCNWCSRIKKNGKLYFLTDDMIAAKWPDADMRDKIGHSAIEEYFPESRGGEHLESTIRIPLEIAEEVNKGHCDTMLKTGGWAGARYNQAGKLISPWWLGVEKFIREIKKIKWMDNHGTIKRRWYVFDDRYTAAEVVYSISQENAFDVAYAAVAKAVRRTTRDAACYVAFEKAHDAAHDAVYNVTRDTASYAVTQDAARDAGLLARYILAEFDETDPDYQHAQARMDVWRAGYGLLCDRDDVLYVYRRA